MTSNFTVLHGAVWLGKPQRHGYGGTVVMGRTQCPVAVG